MPAIVMDGKALAAKIREQVRLQVEQMERKPGMAMVLVGENPAAQVYEAGKRKDCQQCGIYYETYRLPEDVPQTELLDVIRFLNNREGIDGILIQFPLPEHLDDREIQLAIRPDKDVDCVHPSNVGDLTLGVDSFWPCTPAGVMRLLAEYGIDPACKNCTMVGRSNIVGSPGHAAVAPGLHGYCLPHQNSGPGCRVPPGGYSYHRSRPHRPDHGGYGERGGGSSRCGRQPGRVGQTVRRRGI